MHIHAHIELRMYVQLYIEHACARYVYTQQICTHMTTNQEHTLKFVWAIYNDIPAFYMYTHPSMYVCMYACTYVCVYIYMLQRETYMKEYILCSVQEHKASSGLCTHAPLCIQCMHINLYRHACIYKYILAHPHTQKPVSRTFYAKALSRNDTYIYTHISHISTHNC